MAELTSRQKKELRATAQRLPAVASVGKAGLTEGVLDGIKTLLAQHELIKVHIPAGSGAERDTMAAELAAATDSALIAQIGRMVVLYRANNQLDPDRPLPE